MDLQCAKVKNPCKFCLQNVTNKNGLQCMGACGKWAHFKCLSYTPGKISDIKAGIIKVTCPCPDCNTSQPKEFLKKPPISCSNHECPAHKVPKCESKECPVNRKNVVSFPTPPSPQYKEACSPASCSSKSPSSPASPNSLDYPPRNPPTCFIPRTPPTPPTPQTPPTPPSCPPSPPCCAAIPRCSPCPPCCPGTPAPCPPSPPISPCPPPPPKCPPPPPKCPPPPPKCPPPPPKCPPPPPKCPPPAPKCPPPPPKCPPPPPKCPPDNYPPPKCPPKCPSTPRCCSPPCNYPPCSKPPRCPPPRCPPKSQKPACPATPPHLVQNYSATQRPNYSAPQQQTASYVDVGTPMKSPSCSVLSYNVPDVSSSFEKTSSVVLMANKSDYFMSAHEEDIPEEKAALQATSATQITAELDNSPSFGHRCSQTCISTSVTQISYDPEESMVSTMQKMNNAIDELSLKIQTFMKRVEMRQL